VVRLQRLVFLPVLALVAVGCSTGNTLAPPPTQTSAAGATGTNTSTAVGFPGAADGPVLDAARSFVETVTTYDHTKLADQLKALLPQAGEPLKGQLQKSLAADGAFATSVQTNATDARGTVVDLGLVTREGNRAVALVFVDQQIVSPAGNVTQRLRERVTLNQAKSGPSKGSWLATKLETV
jgi:hypothetical protein